jgi:carbon storage regulator CsrA
MLVLTRKPLETIKIGNDIIIQVICAGAKSMRIGIQAPQDVRILRGELEEFSPAADPSRADVIPPFVADAVTDSEPADEAVVVGPMTADQFLAEFAGDWLPGRSIRRMVNAQRPALNATAK